MSENIMKAECALESCASRYNREIDDLQIISIRIRLSYHPLSRINLEEISRIEKQIGEISKASRRLKRKIASVRDAYTLVNEIKVIGEE